MNVFDKPRGPVLVGVVPGQDSTVLDTAAALSAALDAELLVVYVDPSRFRVHPGPDDQDSYAPIDPDAADDDGAPTRLATLTTDRLSGHGLRWRYQPVGGDAAQELARCAATVSAVMIVVGARRRSPAGRLENLLTGSVAAHLAHHQDIPVLVVPSTHASQPGGR